MHFHQLRARQQVDSGELHEASKARVLQELLLLAVVVRAKPRPRVKSDVGIDVLLLQLGQRLRELALGLRTTSLLRTAQLCEQFASSVLDRLAPADLQPA